MLKEQSRTIKRGVACFDVLLLMAAFWLSYRLYQERGALTEISRYSWILLVTVPTVLYFLYNNKLYTDIRFDSIYRIAFKCGISFLSAFIIMAAVLYLTRSGYYSRMLCGLFFFLGFTFVLLEKMAIKVFQNIMRSRGYNTRNVLIIGGGPKVKKLLDIIKNKKQWGINIIENINIGECDLEGLRKILRNKVIDEVYISFSRDTQKKVDFESLLLLLERYGKTVRLAITLDEVVSYSKITFSRTGNLPTLVFHSKTLDPDQELFKRIVDIAGGIVGSLITIALFPVISIAIKSDSPGPVFFGQTRVGMNGRVFRVYKFRSMYGDAEERKKELLDKNKHSGPIFKIDDDPRITRVGKFLRRTSLDEFPQFWNVLKGEMSLVGTRPPTQDEVTQYRGWHYRRVSIRPGITGMWQVNGRNGIRDFDKIVEMDLSYIDNWSLWLDSKILLKTVWVVAKGTGR